MWAQYLWLAGSRAQAQNLWHMGLVASWHIGSSRIRDQTHGFYIGRWILFFFFFKVDCMVYFDLERPEKLSFHESQG